MHINQNKNVTWLTFDIFHASQSLIAVHSTKIGGVSQGYFSTMNLGFARGDDQNHVMENYEIFSKAIQVPHQDMILSDQWHHNNILVADESHKGMGIMQKRCFGDVDGLITDKKNLPLVTFYADCVPIYFYDPVKQVIGMTHAGWRGTATGIVKDMLTLFKTLYFSEIKNILVGIGPAICQTCYEVSEEVIHAMNYDFSTDYYKKGIQEGKYNIDLKGLNKAILLSEGILENHIEVTNLCTKCDEALFFSHRRHGNNRGTQIGVMMLKEVKLANI